MIPKSFALGGITWKVRKKKRVFLDNKQECNGLCDWEKRTIYLATLDVTDEMMEETFKHELVHAILDTMTHPLSLDESFVNTFATFWHQFDKTKKC